MDSSTLVYNNVSAPRLASLRTAAVRAAATFHAAKRTFYATKHAPATSNATLRPMPRYMYLLQDHVTSNATLLYLLQDHVTSNATSRILLQDHVTSNASSQILLQRPGALQGRYVVL